MEQQVLLVKQPAWRPPVGAPRNRLARTLRWSLLLVLLIYLFSQFFHSHTASFVHKYAFGESSAPSKESGAGAAAKPKPMPPPQPRPPQHVELEEDADLPPVVADNEEDDDGEAQQLAAEAKHPTPALSKPGGASGSPSKYILYRAIGNDLPPRHALGQSYTNVKYILENEEPIPEVEKRWVVNRIVVKEEEDKILKLLDEHGQKYIHVPIVLEDYAQRNIRYEGFGEEDIIHSKYFRESEQKQQIEIVDAMLHDKNLYVMHNNGARNIMLEDGIKNGAEWIMYAPIMRMRPGVLCECVGTCGSVVLCGTRLLRSCLRWRSSMGECMRADTKGLFYRWA